jgi:S-adenosylmethionine hydrolase
MEIGTGVTSWYHPSYAEANEGSIFLLQGSSGYLEVSINQGDAAGSTGASAGTSVRLRLM